MYRRRVVGDNWISTWGGAIDGGKGKAMAAAPPERAEPEELTRIQRWRFEELMRAGYALPDALELALRTDVDLHRAASLVQQGCPSEIAVRIVS
jgi:hypothetical protein